MAELEQNKLPPGFILHECPNTGLVIPKPKDWHILEKIFPLHNSCLITREPCEKIDSFYTGLEANVFRNCLGNTGLLPTDYALSQIKALQSHLLYDEPDVSGDGTTSFYLGLFKQLGRVEIYPTGGFAVTSLARYLFVQMTADNNEDILRYLIFHSNPATWEEDMPTRDVMLGNWIDTKSLTT